MDFIALTLKEAKELILDKGIKAQYIFIYSDGNEQILETVEISPELENWRVVKEEEKQGVKILYLMA
ncbi:hypothetical protein SAMN02745227_00105 [Anaerobranca californiensis DSM 14826]|jgi:hypothetical protein|uniref:Uncharacterized protein n=1 Tax=Anaerobranca californiensis DSM 14826 TaxID=1120989 RepID=A0A1M6KFW0_9FIRM|nr:hypothetical protein [Anaerobranca californiensis]SHJ57811.1 hypothetical protein SAMN02745227_00105 [Anaerobranca californiensis DSM 14826]